MTDALIIVLFLTVLIGPVVVVEMVGRRKRDSIGEVRPHLAIFDKNFRRRR